MSPQPSALSPEFSALSPQASALRPQPAALRPHPRRNQGARQDARGSDGGAEGGKRELHGAPGARLRRSHEGACGTAREDSKTLANKEAAYAEMQSLLESHTESCEARQGQPKEQPCGDRRALGPSQAGGPVVSHGSGCRWAGGSGIGGPATAMPSGTWPGSARPHLVVFVMNPCLLALEVGLD